MHEFSAMNTCVRVAAPGLSERAEQALAHEVAALFADTERRFSRFRDDSELAALNRATAPVTVSAELLELLCVARGYANETCGLFDPAIGGALRAAGYDRSFSPGALDRASGGAVTPAWYRELEIDVPRRRVTRPAHLHLDLAGFLKGRTVDRAAQLAPECVMIEAGGDAVVRGRGPDEDAPGWLIEIEDPTDRDRTVATLRLRDRAVATSAANRRRWRTGTGEAHHLIDPRTHGSARSDLAQVTAIAPTAERADVLAKVAYLLGEADGARLLEDQPGVGGVLISRAGAVRVVGDVELADE